MNKDRRKRINRAITMLNEVPWQEITEIVQEVAEEERESADSLAENFPGTDRAERSDEAASQLESVQGDLEMVDIGNLVMELEGAIE